MSDYLGQVLASGKKIIVDTKTPKKPKAPATSIEKMSVPDSDPHKAFVRRCIAERPKKEDVVKDLKRFIAAAEAEL